MAIDTEVKRKSILTMSQTFLPVAQVPNATQPAAWRSSIIWLYAGIALVSTVTPEDDDTDIAVTARTDCDGATVRPPRFEVLHSAESLRNASLHGWDRRPYDRYRIYSDRGSRMPNVGTTIRVFIQSKRAGEVAAFKNMVLGIATTRRKSAAKDTTNRTDCDGATLRVPSLRCFATADSLRNADLQSVATDRDRYRARFPVPRSKTVGSVVRIFIADDGQAGNAAALRNLILGVSTTRKKSGALST